MVEFHLTGIDVAAPPWSLLIEVADATPDRSWVLVGGMMTHLHALRGRVSASRPTIDVDLLVNLDVIAAQIGAVAGPLQHLGLQPVQSQGHFIDSPAMVTSLTSWSAAPPPRHGGRVAPS
ncbi:hypothetical protein SRABI76_03382 [Microbacterium oxydans]|uniref:hypothetical protein n=1 Tax=Microbacterium oxydans TaxID=82380 RepID=UPI001D894F15|nr:hypothetical protein [Microbacterium oxydans]CAH0256733.1 hypothetical protein SRABI76_03382 [Microbacterium oxydans]